MRYEFTIPDWRPPTLNQIMRGKLKTRIRLGRSCHDLISAYHFKSGIPPAKTMRRVSLAIVLGGRDKPCDVDAPWKALLDALKACGALLDDSADKCQIGTLRFERAERSSTTVILEDLDVNHAGASVS